ncbi:MAG: nicotinate-nucleotide--dimethylbenzimidazole phosphoribosyltransferase [Vicinamibacteria bacterium]
MLDAILASIAPADGDWFAKAQERHQTLTKPPGSLGRLETIAARLCAIQSTLRPDVSRRRVVVFAADHGVVAEGVSPYPSEVTAQMVANFIAGGAAINALARSSGSELCVVDVGVGRNLPETARPADGVQFLSRRVRNGTANMVEGPAMTAEEMQEAIGVGIEEAERAAQEGIAVLGLGEMGIGNTTAASAVTAAHTGCEPSRVTGRGTGVDDGTLARKIATVEKALNVNRPRRDDPFDILRKVGGLEIAGLCGLCLGGAAHRLAVVTDGFIATAAAALAVGLSPDVADYLFAAHLSPEPGHRVLLDSLRLEPMLDLEMRLGEGTGAALAMNLMVASAAAFNEMATFESAGIAGKE